MNNRGDTYTVDRETFERTYEEIRPGLFVKTSRVWAKRAERDGEVQTKEGVAQYRAGDYLVYNDPVGIDGYAVGAEKFDELYEREAQAG